MEKQEDEQRENWKMGNDHQSKVQMERKQRNEKDKIRKKDKG